MREDIRIPLTMLSISFLDKLPFKGSYKGKRFMFKKNNDKLMVYLWKDLFSFEKTDEKDIIKNEFEYTKDGINAGIDFIEETSV